MLLRLTDEWIHMVTLIWVNIGSGNGLLPDGIKPLPESMMTNLKISVHDVLECFEMTNLTPKHWETHGCVVSTVATDVLVLKHQAISIHNAD